VRKLTLAIVLACSVAVAFIARAQTPDPNHTVVRFEILADGTNFGSIDIELFDQEKPETVKNFLLYVYSGAYSNLVLHRLEPNFVVQSGHIRIDDPTSTNLFITYPLWADFGRITNEYSVGPQLTNEYGTIAMARVAGQTNSASFDWFLNLTNNAFLDTRDGGFTVFGRVVNTTGPQNGTNLLNYFNTLSRTNGIRNYSITTYNETLLSLPVTTNRSSAPLFTDLFTVRASVIQGNTAGDTTPPTLQVTQPGETFITTTNFSITIAGTAADNQAVARVLYDPPSGRSFVAVGRENWSVELALNFGTNRFSFRSVDYFGNVSATQEVTVVVQEPPLNPNHTIVRFDILTSGTNFGTIDIELFDQEKPETVRNFLLYVYTGGYSNLVLHELAHETNLAILQAGRVVITNPASTDRFTSYVRGQDYGRITNEYGVGPELSNNYGTIAMARIQGQTNSAATDFFFNLTNSSYLNTNQGGYTVFGRVVNTSGARSGTNLLNYFNVRRVGNGAAFVFLPSFEGFQLPVSINRPGNEVLYSDLFTINASVIHGGVAFTRENIAPSVAISEPASDVTTNGSAIFFAGTASDDTDVARVFIDTPMGRFVANGSTGWTADLELTPGTNRVSIRSMDWSGNQSPAATRTIFYSVPRPISLQIQGRGTVAGLTDGQTVELGVTYRLVARPSTRQYFNGWRGDVFSNERTYYFTMREGVTNLIANFTPTLLGLTKGAYTGLFFTTTTNDIPRSSGWISLSLASSGDYFGRLAPVGANYSIRGKFDATGNSGITDPAGTLALTLKLFPESDVIAGAYSDGRFISSVFLALAPKFEPTNPVPAGNYSFVIDPPTDPDARAGNGYGSGTATIDSRGRIRMTGVLGNGTAIRQNTRLLKGNQWPFFVSASAGREAALGWVTFDSNYVLNADMRLISRAFPGGTNQRATLSGSLFTPPSQMRLFNWTNGLLTLSGGGVIPPINANVELNEDGSFTILSNTNNIQLSVPDAKGTIKGSFTHPVTQTLTPLRGAVVQASNINMAAGLFGTGTNSGLFLIRSQ
jgi:cyclophilin family peptidyl-prolyl cis-trans isomerase